MKVHDKFLTIEDVKNLQKKQGFFSLRIQSTESAKIQKIQIFSFNKKCF